VKNAQRQILCPLSFRFRKLGDKRVQTNSAPFIIQKQQVERWAETNYGHSAYLFTVQRRSCPVAHRDKLWSLCVSSLRLDRVQQNAETNYGHSASCINQGEQIRQYQDDVSVLIIFNFLQVPLAGRFTGRVVFRSNEISVLSLLPFYLQ